MLEIALTGYSGNAVLSCKCVEINSLHHLFLRFSKFLKNEEREKPNEGSLKPNKCIFMSLYRKIGGGGGGGHIVLPLSVCTNSA